MADHRHRVEHLHEVERNILQFNKDLANHPELVARCVSQLKSAEYRGHFVHSTANTEIYEFTLDRA